MKRMYIGGVYGGRQVMFPTLVYTQRLHNLHVFLHVFHVDHVSGHHSCSQLRKVSWLAHIAVLEILGPDDRADTHDHTEEGTRTKDVLTQGIGNTVGSTVLQNGVTAENKPGDCTDRRLYNVQ